MTNITKLTDKEFEKRIDNLTRLDASNHGRTHYLETFLKEQDKLSSQFAAEGIHFINDSKQQLNRKKNVKPIIIEESQTTSSIATAEQIYREAREKRRYELDDCACLVIGPKKYPETKEKIDKCEDVVKLKELLKNLQKLRNGECGFSTVKECRIVEKLILKRLTILKRILKQQKHQSTHQLNKKWLPQFDKEDYATFAQYLTTIALSPFRGIQLLFDLYIEDLTILKGVVLSFFAFTSLFVAFVSCYKIKYAFIKHFDPSYYSAWSGNDMPWMLLLVIWLLPFILHIGLKIVIPIFMLFIILLVGFEVVTGDASFTNMFLHMLNSPVK